MVENGEKGKIQVFINWFWECVNVSELSIKLHNVLLIGCRSRRPKRFSDITHVPGQIFPRRCVRGVNSGHHATFVLFPSEAIDT